MKLAAILEIVKQHVALQATRPDEDANVHVGRCPFHQERTPSFHVNTDLGIFRCFGCGAHGDAEDFKRLIEADRNDKKTQEALDRAVYRSLLVQARRLALETLTDDAEAETPTSFRTQPAWYAWLREAEEALQHTRDQVEALAADRAAAAQLRAQNDTLKAALAEAERQLALERAVTHSPNKTLAISAIEHILTRQSGIIADQVRALYQPTIDAITTRLVAIEQIPRVATELAARR